jgi:heme exporter protein D
MAFNTFLIIVVIILLAERITYSRTLLRQIFSKSMTKWLKNYSTNKKSFWGWLIMLIVFGLFGFWCPIFYNGLNDRPLNIGSIVLQGSLSTFSIVVLIEGILVDRTLPKGQRANFLISSVAISLVALHILVYGFTNIWFAFYP